MLHKLMIIIFRRRVMLALLLLIQFVIIAFLITQSVAYSIFWESFFTILAVVVALHVVWKKGKEAYKITWVLQILIFPVYGTLFYIMFNRQTKTRKLQRKLEEIYGLHRKHLNIYISDYKRAKTEYSSHSSQMHYLQETMGFPVYGNTDVSYYSTGETYHEAMLEAMKEAKEYIFFEFFIVANGKMWESMLEIMEEKAAKGIEVRVMYDDIGSFIKLDPDMKEKLEAKGIQCRIYNPFNPIITSSQNNRDHRKVLSIDGKVAFTGGINIADEYINKIERFGHWKDTGIKMKGPGAWGQTLIFLQLWQTMDEELTEELVSPLIPTFIHDELDYSKGFIQPYGDSPTDTQNVGEHVFMKLIHEAKESVWIFTPYLILDENLETALTLAAKSGIDVKIVTPGIPDKPPVHTTTRSYYLELIKAGAKIYEYTDGFMHAKSIVVDDDAAVIGSINFDYRSLYLHFENAVALYGNPAIIDMKRDFEETVERSTQIDLKDINQTFLVRLWKSILRLFAPLM